MNKANALALLITMALCATSCKKEDRIVQYQVDCGDCIVSWDNQFNHQFTEVVKGSMRVEYRVPHDYRPKINVRPAPGKTAYCAILMDGKVLVQSTGATYTEAYQYP